MAKKFCATAMLVLAFACKQQTGQLFHVSVSFVNADKLAAADGSGMVQPARVAYLEEIIYGKEQAPVVLDSVKITGASGSFELKGRTRGESIYEVVFGNGQLAIPLVNDAASVSLTADLAKRDDYYTVKNSPASEQLHSLLDNMGKKSAVLENSLAMLDSLKRAKAGDSILISATDAKNAAVAGLNDYLRTFIAGTSSPTLGTLALSWSVRSMSPTEFDSAFLGLQKKFPDNAALKSLKQDYDARNSAQQPQDESWVGKTAPDLSLPDPNGKMISIASFRGKYVLVDFWASWCGPCRMENPNVVSAYNEYRNRNFTVLGVSLDKDRDAWKEAIANDHLTWTHMSDLAYWNSNAVKVFGFQGIPFNILIDPSGKIIAQELRGSDLATKLNAVLP